jgi:hypothetical protein
MHKFDLFIYLFAILVVMYTRLSFITGLHKAKANKGPLGPEAHNTAKGKGTRGTQPITTKWRAGRLFWNKRQIWRKI